MRKVLPLILVMAALIFCAACGDKPEPVQQPVQQPEPQKVETPKEPTPMEKLAQTLKATCQEGVEPSFEELEAISNQFRILLPETTGELEGYNWEVSCSKNKDEKEMLFSLELKRPKGEEKEQAMWFHVLYNPSLPQKDRDEYGNETFESYKANLASNMHLWILVNNMEIRGVADAEDFKNDAKIKMVMAKFKLKDMETL